MPASDNRESIYLDDLTVGQKFISPEHELSADEIMAFAKDYDPQPFHTDEQLAKPTFFGGLAASGWHTAAITMRLVVNSLSLGGGVIGAGGELAWPQPTRPGDRLQVETEILELKPSRSRADRGSAVVRCTTRNHKGETLQTLTCRLILQRRGDEIT